MSAGDLELCERFLDAVTAAAATGERDAVYPFLAPDVEWVTPQRSLHGLTEVREQLTWAVPPEKLDVEFEQERLTDVGDGRVVAHVHEIYRMKGSGDLAYARDRRVELTIRDRKIARYEMRVIG